MSVVRVGSTNPVKVAAVREVLAECPELAGLDVVGVAVSSGVSEQPLDLEQTYRGAEHRARAVAGGARFAVGLEDGMYPCPTQPERYLNVCVACVLHEDRLQFGASSSFMYPEAVVRRVLDEGLDVSQALRANGLTDHPKVGADIGAIGLLSNGRLVRKDYTKQAVIAAMLPWL